MTIASFPIFSFAKRRWGECTNFCIWAVSSEFVFHRIIFEDVYRRVKEATKNVRGNETILTFTKSTEEY